VAGEILYRRAPHIVCYWKSGQFIFHNYASDTRCGASALACDVLNFFEDWKSLADLQEYKPAVESPVLQQLVDALVKVSLVHRADQPLPDAERAMGRLDRWNPEAGFFHSATKNVQYVESATVERELLALAENEPMPPAIKRYPGSHTVTLPPPTVDGPFADVLLARRSWRRFGEGTIPLATFSNLLGLTAGVQQWVDVPGQGRVALKTSPSGGARHSIEVYVLAWRIDGLAAGLYHYAPDIHALESVQAGLGSSRVPSYLPEGGYWTDACALVLFSSVYERETWRYHYSRAYRAPLVEAGHLCQTFCLLATSYGLAPFCAMALGDKAIEQDLQLDGISESVLYAAGVGIRPTGLAWAPAPQGLEAPRAAANPYLRPSADR
jgi:SagB-type dehydrogenase family enzyme